MASKYSLDQYTGMSIELQFARLTLNMYKWAALPGQKGSD